MVLNPEKIVISIAVTGNSGKWKKVLDLCEQIIDDERGLAVGVLNRKLKGHSIKFMLLFTNRPHNSSEPLFVVNMKEIEMYGLESVLQRLGEETIKKIMSKEF